MKKQVVTMAMIAMMSFGAVSNCVAQDTEWKTAFMRYLVQNIDYPSTAQAAQQEGTFYARFTIDKEGKVKDLTVCETVPTDGTLLNEINVVGYKHHPVNTHGNARESFTTQIQHVMQHAMVAVAPEQAGKVWVLPFSFSLISSKE